MYCPKCGKEISENSFFCVTCGAPASNDSKSKVPQLNKAKNSVFAWIMSTIPITGIIIGAILGFGYASLALNIIFGYMDEKSLREQGVNTETFGKMAFLVPYYLYKRAVALGDSLAYFIVWIVLFSITLFI